MTTILLVLLLGAFQDDEASGLVERLRSDSVEERTKAEIRLKELGAAAVPALQKAASGSDPDHSARARHILVVIGLMESLSARLRRLRPGVEERLAAGAPGSWTKELLEILEGPKGAFEWKDLAPLLSAALKGAATTKDKLTLLEAADEPRSPEVVPDVVPFFEDKDETVRLTAARVCGRVGGPDVFRASARLLRRETAGAPETVLEALGTMEWDVQLCVYLGLLESAEAFERIDLLAVARHATPFLTEELLNRWRNDDVVRRELRPVFRALDPDAAILQVLSRDHCREVELDECPLKILLLGDFDGAAAKAAVLAALGSENSSTRWTSSHVAAELGLKEAAAPLRRLLQDPGDSRVRASAATALARLGLRDAAPAIAPLLTDADEHVRGEAAEALGRLGAAEYAPTIIELLRDRSWSARKGAANAFGGLGAAGLSEAIVRYLGSERREVRQAAARALGRMGLGSALPKIVPALDEPDDRETVFEVFGMLGTRDDVRNVSRLPLPKQHVPGDLIEGALWRIGRRDPGAVPVLLELLADRSAETRARIARTLARVGAESSAARLADALGDAKPEVREAAATALGVLGAKDFAERVERLLEDRLPEVRRAAAGSLCRLGSRRGVVPLLEAPRDWRMPKLTPLNALRRPEEWQAWAGKRLDRDLRGPFSIVVGRLAARAGMRLDLSQVEDYVPGQLWSTASEGWTLIDALDYALGGEPVDVILEPGLLKLVRAKQADEFWRRWKDER